jgi:hypothetical protein
MFSADYKLRSALTPFALSRGSEGGQSGNGAGEIGRLVGERDSLRPTPWSLKLYYAKPPILSMVIVVHHPISPGVSHHHRYNIMKSYISHGLLIVFK